MAARKGNIDWQKRSKHGRKTLFKNPELMWKETCRYFQNCDDNPWFEKKPMITSIGNNSGSEVEMVDVPHRIPYTMRGLCFFLKCNTDYFNAFEKTTKNEGFSEVIKQIREVIDNNKFTGAAIGMFNANIISRDLGLVDKADITSKGKSVAPIPDALKTASLDELRQLLNKEDVESNNPA